MARLQLLTSRRLLLLDSMKGILGPPDCLGATCHIRAERRVAESHCQDLVGITFSSIIIGIV